MAALYLQLGLDNMNLIELIKLKYPHLENLVDYQIGDDGTGQKITAWNNEEPKPTVADINNLKNDVGIKAQGFQIQAEQYIRSMIEAKPHEKGYDSILTLATYITSENAQWQAEAVSFIKWRDRVFEYSYSQLAIAQQTGNIPTLEEFMLNIPLLVWP